MCRQLGALLTANAQLVHYDVKQHYLGHHDYAHKWESTDNPYVQGGGNRYVTVRSAVFCCAHTDTLDTAR